MAKLEAPVGGDQRPHQTQPELLHRRGVYSQSTNPGLPRVPVRIMNVTNQEELLSEGNTIGHGESAVWASNIEDHQSEPRQKKQLSKQLREVIAGARPNLSIRESQALELIADYQDIFETKRGEHERTEKVYHRIETGDARAIRQPPRRLPLGNQAEVKNLLEDMKSKGVIEESDSPWT